MINRNRKLGTLGFLALLIVLVSGCTAKQNLPAEEVVRQRAQAWADALLAGDLTGAYELTSPGYREYSSAALYQSHVLGASNWTSAVVDGVECDTQEGICSVQIMVAYEIAHLKMKNTRPVAYKWLEVDGEWWLYVPAK